MTKTDFNLSPSPVIKPLSIESMAMPAFIVDDAELLSILASNEQHQNHAWNHFETPKVAILDWEDWNQDVPEFVNNKRKRNGGDLVDSDDEDEEEEFNFLDQFDFVDVSFDHPALPESNKKQKITNTTVAATTATVINNNNINFVDESADDLSTLLQQSGSLIAELDCGWVLDITS